jgi:hypothetical protein
MQTLNKFKALAVLLVCFAAVLGQQGSARAGNVYITFYYYTWQTSFTTTLYYSNEGQTAVAGNWTYPLADYEYAGSNLDPVGSTGPNGPNITEPESIYIYEGGPAYGSYSSFLSGEPYVTIINGYHWLSTQTEPDSGGETVTFFTEQYPFF